MSAMSTLLEANRRWAQAKLREDRDYFHHQAEGQHPRYLWIGCSDSRVPPGDIMELGPGEAFVHRNMGNLVAATDMSCQSTIAYAVDVLQVEHVIVCGHYGCGAMAAALAGTSHTVTDYWLHAVRELAEQHHEELARIDGLRAREDRLSELNVRQQVQHVAETHSVLDAWKAGRPVAIHGLMYSYRDGLLEDMGLCLQSEECLAEVFRMHDRPESMTRNGDS